MSLSRSDFFKMITCAAAVPLTARAESAPEIQEVPAGKLYAIEIPGHIPLSAGISVRDSLKPFEDRFNCKFMVLGGGARLVPAVTAEDVLEAHRVGIVTGDEAARALRLRTEETTGADALMIRFGATPYCECGGAMVFLDLPWPLPAGTVWNRRRMECQNENCRFYKVSFLEPMIHAEQAPVQNVNHSSRSSRNIHVALDRVLEAERTGAQYFAEGTIPTGA